LFAHLQLTFASCIFLCWLLPCAALGPLRPHLVGQDLAPTASQDIMSAGRSSLGIQNTSLRPCVPLSCPHATVTFNIKASQSSLTTIWMGSIPCLFHLCLSPRLCLFHPFHPCPSPFLYHHLGSQLKQGTLGRLVQRRSTTASEGKHTGLTTCRAQYNACTRGSTLHATEAARQISSTRTGTSKRACFVSVLSTCDAHPTNDFSYVGRVIWMVSVRSMRAPRT
jgi:hypothetical protein